MPSPRPNILLLLTDQQRFDTIQALGSRFAARTPHMDAMAHAGVAFDNAFCTAPICSPSRATMFTGLYPGQAGMPGLVNAPSAPLRTSLPTVGKLLRAAGYQTAYHGKWHLGTPLHEHGFEVAEDCSHDETTCLLASRFWKDRDWMIHDRPFFQTVSYLNPHDLYFYDPARRVPGFKRPWANAPSTGEELSRIARTRQEDWPEERWGAYFEFYCQLLERVDGVIGETLHQLRCSGFAQNTWIIFSADHGDMAGEHDIPFKGQYCYEGVTHVPLIIVPPQTRFAGPQPGLFDHDIAPGRRPHLCSLIDLVPTILDLAGAGPGPENLSGRSLLPVVRDAGAAAPHEYVFASWPKPEMRMVRSATWKYIAHEDGEEELFSVAEDPAETRDLALTPEWASQKGTLVAALKEHLARTGDPFTSPAL